MEISDSNAVIRAELDKVQEALPGLRNQVTLKEVEAADLRGQVRELEANERQYMIALKLKRPPRKKKGAPEPEKPKRGRPPKAKAVPPPADVPAPDPPAEPEAEKQLYPEDAEARCTRIEPHCGWYGKKSELKDGRCPEEDCRCYAVEITEEERA